MDFITENLLEDNHKALQESFKLSYINCETELVSVVGDKKNSVNQIIQHRKEQRDLFVNRCKLYDAETVKPLTTRYETIIKGAVVKEENVFTTLDILKLLNVLHNGFSSTNEPNENSIGSNRHYNIKVAGSYIGNLVNSPIFLNDTQHNSEIQEDDRIMEKEQYEIKFLNRLLCEVNDYPTFGDFKDKIKDNVLLESIHNKRLNIHTLKECNLLNKNLKMINGLFKRHDKIITEDMDRIFELAKRIASDEHIDGDSASNKIKHIAILMDMLDVKIKYVYHIEALVIELFYDKAETDYEILRTHVDSYR